MSFVWFCNFRVISVCFFWGKSVLAASLSKSCLETKNNNKQNLWFSGLFSWICFGSVKIVHSRSFQTRMKSIASQNLKTPRGIRLDFHASSVVPHAPTAIWSISVDLMCCYIRRKPPHSKTHQKNSPECAASLCSFLCQASMPKHANATAQNWKLFAISKSRRNQKLHMQSVLD